MNNEYKKILRECGLPTGALTKASYRYHEGYLIEYRSVKKGNVEIRYGFSHEGDEITIGCIKVVTPGEEVYDSAAYHWLHTNGMMDTKKWALNMGRLNLNH